MNSYDYCEQQWSWAYQERITPVGNKNVAMDLGTYVHEGMDVYYSNGCDPQAVLAWMQATLDDMRPDEVVEVSKALFFLKLYMDRVAPVKDKGHKIISSEIHLVIPYKTPKGRQVLIQAYIDLLTRADGLYWLWDHKTLNQKFWAKSKLESDFQTTLYCAMLRRLNYVVRNILINQVNTYLYKDAKNQPLDKYFQRGFTVRTDPQLNFAEKHALRKIDRIIDNSADPVMAWGWRCAGCHYRELCNSVQIGLSPSNLIKAKFKQRESRNEKYVYKEK